MSEMICMFMRGVGTVVGWGGVRTGGVGREVTCRKTPRRGRCIGYIL